MRTVKDSNERKFVSRQQKDPGLRVQARRLYRRTTIDVLPDDVLLEIFKFYLDGGHHVVDAWHKLVHVCRRWRQLVFASPRQLNLRLLCTSERPVETLLDIWPELPIVIEDAGVVLELDGITNIDAALEHNDRVCEITIDSAPSPILDSFAVMKEPFPALTSLELRSSYSNWHVPVLPDSFLDGSAPRLRTLKLCGIPFPGLPQLLLSAPHLVHLCLHSIPNSGFIPPGEMANSLSSLTNLKVLELEYRYPPSPSHQTDQHQPPLTRTVLPSLTSLSFKGISEYLEVIVARIDVPFLNDIKITFFHQAIFDTPLLHSFICRTEAFEVFHRAEILFSHDHVQVTLLREEEAHNGVLQLGISCKPSNWQLSSLVQVFKSSLPSLPTLERLEICEYLCVSRWQGDMEDAQWLELLRPFITVKSLYLDKKVAPCVAPALQELAGERVTEVLPSLQNVFVEGPVQRGIAKFISARQPLGHQVTIDNWDKGWWE